MGAVSISVHRLLRADALDAGVHACGRFGERPLAGTIRSGPQTKTVVLYRDGAY